MNTPNVASPQELHDQQPQREAATVASDIPHYHPGHLVLSSDHQAWHGIVVHSFHNPPAEAMLPGVPDHWVILHLRHPVTMQRRVAGRLQQGQVYPGDSSLIPLLAPTEWICREWADVLHMHLHPSLVAQVAREAIDRDPAYIELSDHFAIHDPLIEQIGCALRNELHHGGVAGRVYAESLAHTLTVHLLRHHSSLTPRDLRPAGSLSAAQLSHVRAYIEAHLAQDVLLARLAALVNMSVYHFTRVWKQATGLAPHQYVIRCRIERAKQLLMHEALSIGEVAAQVGFFDQSHFSRTFTRIIGLTPKMFLQHQRKNVLRGRTFLQDTNSTSAYDETHLLSP